jgi:NAD(P)-dependent dehydrogenase (short-subunit alcohol dehydrogenase family)
MLRRIYDASRVIAPASTAGATPMGRSGKPEEVIRVVVWLCTEAASYVTGVAMPVDGGYVA